MQRRTLLGCALAGLAPLNGCTGSGLGRSTQSPTTRHNDDDATTTATPFETRADGVDVTLEILDRQMPAPDESVAGSFDCEASTAVLTGWIRPPTGCHELVVGSFDHHPDSNESEVVLASRSEKEDDGRTCEGVKVKYRLTLAYEREVPDVIRVRYASPEDDAESSFEVRNGSC